MDLDFSTRLSLSSVTTEIWWYCRTLQKDTTSKEKYYWRIACTEWANCWWNIFTNRLLTRTGVDKDWKNQTILSKARLTIFLRKSMVIGWKIGSRSTQPRKLTICLASVKWWILARFTQIVVWTSSPIAVEPASTQQCGSLQIEKPNLVCYFPRICRLTTGGTAYLLRLRRYNRTASMSSYWVSNALRILRQQPTNNCWTSLQKFKKLLNLRAVLFLSTTWLKLWTCLIISSIGSAPIANKSTSSTHWSITS